MTQTELDTIAPQMDRAARELAHATGYDTPDAFARGYVLAVAECCGAASADQCAPGEAWALYETPRPGAFDVQGLARR